MDRRVFWLKPCRSTNEMPVFQREWPLFIQARGGQTCATLDLNILDGIQKYLATPPQERSSQMLQEIAEIKDILETPAMYVAPGFALGEVDQKYLESLVESYERFFDGELVNYRDAPNAEPVDLEAPRSRKFKALQGIDQGILAAAQLSLLKSHHILLSEPELTAEEKFDLYLDYMDRVADFVPRIEAEIAKHLFFKASKGSNDPFLHRSYLIQSNFNKGGSGEKRLDRALNGARDIMYLRCAAAMDGKPLDGKIQDTWLLTRDAGIAALCETVFFAPMDGERAKYTALVDYQTRASLSYWRYVDTKEQGLLIQRQSAGRGTRRSVESQMAAHTKLALELSEELLQLTGVGPSEQDS